MASTILGNLWQTKLFHETANTAVHQKFMQALGEYITSNVTFNCTFVGTLKSPPNTPLTSPDIVRLDGSEVSTYKVSFGDPNGSDGIDQWLTWIKNVYTGIRKAKIIGPMSIPITQPCYAFPTMIEPTWTRNDLLVIHKDSWKDPQAKIMDAIANKIMLDMQKFYIPTFPSNYNIAYIGTTTVNKVITL